MSDRVIQVRFMLKFQASMAGDRVDFVSVDMHHDYDTTPMDPYTRVIEFDLNLPETLWKAPVIRGTVKTQLEQMLTEFVEGMEVDAN